MQLTADDIIGALKMKAHHEGGYYAFCWKSARNIPKAYLPPVYPSDRKAASLIYYLLKAGQTSCWHKLLSDEYWLWHCGGTLEMTLGGDGRQPEPNESILIGPGLAKGERFQALAPEGHWQTTQVKEGDFALVSCIVSPGYEPEDFSLPPASFQIGG